MVRVKRCREAACVCVDDVRYVVSRCCTYVWYVKVWFCSMGGYMFGGMWVVDFLSLVLCVPTVCD